MKISTEKTHHTDSVSVPSWMETLRRIGLVGYVLCAGYLTVLVLSCLDNAVSVAITAFALVVGYAVADLISGLVHWASDNFGQRDDAVIGPMFVIPFRDHHHDPQAITRESILELHGINCFNLLPVLALGIAIFDPSSVSGLSLFVAALVLGIAYGVIAATQIHRWVHQDEVPRYVEALQRLGLVISREAHAIHHREPHDEYYCIASGWWNRPLCQTRFYRRAEALIERVAGVQPARHEELSQ